MPATYGNIIIMKKATVRLEDEIFNAINSRCERHGDFQWLINKALKSVYCKEDKPVKKRESFLKPTIEQVKQYCFERGGVIDGEKFYDYCEANGWKLSNGNRMKDWKAAIRTWEGRKREQQQRKESLVERVERKSKEKVAAIEAIEHPMDSNDSPLWIQVDKR